MTTSLTGTVSTTATVLSTATSTTTAGTIATAATSVGQTPKYQAQIDLTKRIMSGLDKIKSIQIKRFSNDEVERIRSGIDYVQTKYSQYTDGVKRMRVVNEQFVTQYDAVQNNWDSHRTEFSKQGAELIDCLKDLEKESSLLNTVNAVAINLSKVGAVIERVRNISAPEGTFSRAIMATYTAYAPIVAEVAAFLTLVASVGRGAHKAIESIQSPVIGQPIPSGSSLNSANVRLAGKRPIQKVVEELPESDATTYRFVQSLLQELDKDNSQEVGNVRKSVQLLSERFIDNYEVIMVLGELQTEVALNTTRLQQILKEAHEALNKRGYVNVGVTVATDVGKDIAESLVNTSSSMLKTLRAYAAPITALAGISGTDGTEKKLKSADKS